MKKTMISLLSILCVSLCACHPSEQKKVEKEVHNTTLIADREMESLAHELDVMQNFQPTSPQKKPPQKQIYFSSVPIEQIKMVGSFILRGHSTAFLVYKHEYQSVQLGDCVSNESIHVETIESSRVTLSAYPDKFVIPLDSKTEEKTNESQ